ncbi:MAG TPA: hypothetical protein VGF84_07745 [Micromonosporaceae bacterium]|jgi:hypothetical protein
MNTSAIVGIVVVVVVVLVLAAVAGRILVQRRELRERYGDEYQRVVTEKGGRAAAEAELKRREREHEKLQLNELSPEVRDSYRTSWTELQSQFVDDPKAAVHSADQLVTRLVADRGYPVVDYTDRLAHLSVEHASVLNLYRSAHDISVRNDSGTATTEELRQALVNYRELIADLLGDPSLANGGTASTVAADAAAPVTAEPPVEAATPVDAPVLDSPADIDDVAPATPGRLSDDGPADATRPTEATADADAVDTTDATDADPAAVEADRADVDATDLDTPEAVDAEDADETDAEAVRTPAATKRGDI